MTGLNPSAFRRQFRSGETMRRSSQAGVLSVLALVAVGIFNAEVSAQGSPNVVVIISDDAGYADFGFMNGLSGTTSVVPTPNLDALAARGVKFSRAYVAQSCQPTRAALVTGGYQNRIGNEVVGNNDFGLPADATTIWDRMKSQGYSTGAVGKWHLGSIDGPQGNRPQTQGIDEFYGIWHGSRTYSVGNTGLPETQLLREAIVDPNGSVTDTVVEAAHSGQYITNTFGQYGVDFINDHYTDTNPFFLYQSFTAPHTPVNNSPDFNDPSIAGLSGLQKQYASMMLTMDKEIGRILDKIDDPAGDGTGPGNDGDSIRDNTLIIFVNDNGGPLALAANGADNGNLRDGKGSPYEGGIRVPMIIAGAGVTAPGGSIYDKPVHGVDILPTAFAAGGGSFGPSDTGIDGVDLLPFINGTNTADPHQVLVHRHRKQFSVVKGDWTLVNSGGSSTSSHQLFNVATDVSQTTNVAGANPTIVAELRRDLTDYEAVFDKQRYAILGTTEEATINLFDHFTFNPSAPTGGSGGTTIIGDGGGIGVASSGNGNFESKTGAVPGANSTWPSSEVPNWHNLSGAESQTFGTNQGTIGSPEGSSYGAYIFQSFTMGNDTPYTISAAGETFDVSLALHQFGSAGNYNSDEDAVVTLFTSTTGVTDSTVLGDITVLGSTSFPITGSWTDESAPAFYTSIQADVGKTVYLGVTLSNPTGANVFPRIDVVKLTTSGGGSGGTSFTSWSSNGAWFEGGTSNVETMFNSDAFAGAVLEFPTTDTFSYTSNNDMVRETGLEFMLNKIALSGTFNGVQNESATIQGNDVLFTNDLDGVGPQIAVDASNGGGNSYSYNIDLNLIMYNDLTITGDGDVAVNINGQISDYFTPRNLIKSGTSTVTLTGNNTYSGDTTVDEGTLSITNAFLEDTADVYLTTGAIFDLAFGGTDTIDSLFIDDISQATGTWGAIGSGAANESALFTGTGMLLVSTLEGLSGDFNGDGRVDGLDFLKWQRDDGSASGLAAWEANYGAVSLSATSAAVPEPSSWMMLAIAVCLAGFVRR